MTQAVTSIDPRLIALVGRKLYSSNPLPIVVRELLQNSIDACHRKGVEPDIKITIREVDGNWDDFLVICEDNGIGMTAEQIVTDFLRLGGKKEDATGQTGGFGIAKAAIMGCGDWQVRSLDNYLNKQMLENSEDIRKVTYRDGTKITVRITENVYDSSLRKALQMIYYSDVKVHLIVDKPSYAAVRLNDENAGLSANERKLLDENPSFDLWGVTELEPPEFKGDLRFPEHGWNVIRLNGLMQFHYGSRKDHRHTNLFFDIKTDADPDDKQYPFSMSRESLEGGYDELVSAFIDSHNANVVQSVAAVVEELPEEERIDVLTGRLLTGSRDSRYREQRSERDVGMGNKTAADFIIEEKMRRIREENTAPVQMLIRRYKREPEKKSWHAKIMLAWQDVLQLVTETDEEFGIGITSDRFREASRTTLDGVVYYVINPDLAVNEILKEQSSEAIVLYLWSLACHEATHKYVDDHSEWFTTTMGDIQRDSSEVILRCFREIAKKRL